MRIGHRAAWGVAWTFAMAVGGADGALADDVAQRGVAASGETLALEQAAVDPAILETQAGTAPDAAPGAADLAGMPAGANGPSSLDRPSFAASQASVTGGAVSSSMLQATTAGGTVSVGQ